MRNKTSLGASRQDSSVMRTVAGAASSTANSSNATASASGAASSVTAAQQPPTRRPQHNAPAQDSESRFDWRSFKALLFVVARGEKRQKLKGSKSLSKKAGKKKGMAALQGAGQYFALAISLIIVAVWFFFLGGELADRSSAPIQIFNSANLVVLFITVFFSFLSGVNILYYSKEIYFYLKLPVKASTIVMAKFLHFMGITVGGELIFLVGYFSALYHMGAAPIYYVILFFTIVFTTLTASTVLTVLLVLFMNFTKFAHNKDRFAKISTSVVIVAMMVGVGLFQIFFSSGELNAGTFVGGFSLFAQLSNPLGIVSFIFTPIMAFSGLLFSGSLLQVIVGLLLALVVTLVYLAILMLVALRFYLPGAKSMQGSGATRSHKKFSNDELAKALAPRKLPKSIFDIDSKRCFRNPSFFTQTVLSRLLSPFFLVFIAAGAAFLNVTKGGLSFAELYATVTGFASSIRFGTGFFPVVLIILVGWATVPVFNAMFFTMQAVSRDGQDFFKFKALPLNWRSYLWGKLLTEASISFLPSFVLTLILLAVLHPNLELTVLAVLIFLATSFIETAVFVAAGSWRPKLSWDSAVELFRGPSKFIAVYVSMISSLIVSILPVGLMFLSSFFLQAPDVVQLIIFIAVYVIEIVLAYLLIDKVAPRWLERLQKD